eukprot:s1132_g24.t1
MDVVIEPENPEPQGEGGTLEMDLISDREPGFSGLWVGPELDLQSLSYEPSLCPTDFSGELPFPSGLSGIELSSDYNPNAVVSAAWNSLRSEVYKMPWENNFWDQFLDPSVSVMDQLSSGFKRPLPAPAVAIAGSSESSEVDRRVAAKTFPVVTSFLQHIRDVPERSWQEERDALWETAIRRWVALIDHWEPGDSMLLNAIRAKSNFTDKAQILVDVFYNKAPQTLIKRVNSLNRLCSELSLRGQKFPCDEDELYVYLKREASAGAPASRMKACFEAVVFARHILGLEALQQVVTSKRCLGAASSSLQKNPNQAQPFTVRQLQILHEKLRSASEIWDRAMSGMLLFCIYGRSRWSDAQHASELVGDYDDAGLLRFLEVKTAVHKTARAFHLRHMFLPISAPTQGVTSDNWGEQWMIVRQTLNIDNLNELPLMPAPDRQLEPTKRPVSTQEAKLWIRHLLGDEVTVDAKLTSHSCKCTCLSFLAKRGIQFEDRLALGYHANKLRMALTYSRDSAARPLAVLSHVLREIREGLFEPDNTRSGRLKAGAASLDRIGLEPEPQPEQPVEVQSDAGSCEAQQSEQSEFKSWHKVSVESAGAVSEPPDEEGHVTTDSSDDSDSDHDAWGPVVGHYLIELPEDKNLWVNRNSKMFHLSREEHVRVLLCGRRISASFERHSGKVRFDSAKCRQCFRLKDS